MGSWALLPCASHSPRLRDGPLKRVKSQTFELHEPTSNAMQPQQYIRPTNDKPLMPPEKKELLQAYFSHYESVAQQDADSLNVKLPRAAVADVLDQVGGLLLERSRQLALTPGPMREFLEATEPPECLGGRLPDEFRAFSLLLNSLKQWVSAESAATDRFLLGGTARKQCRQMADHCLITGQHLERADVELHHPVRDGRPPIPLSKTGHDRIESTSRHSPEPFESALRELKRQGNRSWVMLRRGCMALAGEESGESTPAVLASSKTFARKAKEATGLSYQALVEWLDQRDLGI